MSTFVGIFGVSGVILVGAVTIWASLASAGKAVPAWAKLSALIGALGLFVGAMSLFSPALANEELIPVPPATTLVAPGPPAELPSEGRGVTIYSSDFVNADGKWRLGPVSKMGSTESMQVTGDGKLGVDFRSGGGRYVLNLNVDTPAMLDSEIEAVIERLEGPSSMAYGLLFRSNDAVGQLYFLINSDQYFGVFVQNKDGNSMDRPVQWTRSSSINPTGPNKLKVITRGNSISVFANDQPLTTFEYNNQFSGSAGAYVILYEPNETGRILIDDFRVSRAR